MLNVRILMALAVVIATSRAAGWAISKVGQPRVHGEILAGIALGPSVLGVLWPQALSYVFPSLVIGVLSVVAQVGVALFMFLVGFSVDLSRLRGNGHKAVVISHSSIVAPIALGAPLSVFLYPRLGGNVDRLGFALFLGAAMAITAFPVLARVLQETGLTDTHVGVLAITCAAVDDVTAWCILAVVVAVIHASGFASAVQTIALWGITALVIVTAIAGKWGGSMLAARAMGETWTDATAIGILMNTRGLTELIILTVGLQLGVITPLLFTIMVLVALITTLMATPMLALFSPIYHRGMTSVDPGGGQ